MFYFCLQSTSSGLTGCVNGITDFLFTSLEQAFLISVERKYIQLTFQYPKTATLLGQKKEHYVGT